jgi:hypothetical protein
MTKIVSLPQLLRDDTQPQRPIEFTHELTPTSGWAVTTAKPDRYARVVYLGECSIDGDMFAAYYEVGDISIFKGHYNDGTI